MRVGMTLPSMLPGMTRELFADWCRGIDGGPFSSLAMGERVTYPNQELLTTLAAAAALTERVEIISTVVVLPMHSEVLVAKAAANIDVISGGRFTLGVGVGGRDADFRAVGASFQRRHQRMDEQVARMQRIWRGEPPGKGLDPVGPAPVQPGGPPLLNGALGPKSIRRSAEWAAGIAGFDLVPSAEITGNAFRTAEAAWEDAGRDTPPRRMTSFWYGVGAGGEDRLRDYVRSYMGIFGDAAAEAAASVATAHSRDALGKVLRELRDVGADDVVLVPTANTLDQLEGAAEVVAGL